jgi:hypothetical protein
VITNEAITMIAIAAKIICCMRMLRRCLLFGGAAFLPLRDIGDSIGHDTMGFSKRPAAVYDQLIRGVERYGLSMAISHGEEGHLYPHQLFQPEELSVLASSFAKRTHVWWV